MKKAEMQVRYREALHLIPTHMRHGMVDYVEHGRKSGGFMMAMLCGDENAKLRADALNRAALETGMWAEFMTGFLPQNCHGSPLKVEAWLKMGGLDGYPDGGT